jgi:multicomponent Na+:H+ antiporter subunit E
VKEEWILMKKFSAWLSTFILCFCFWELLVWSVNPREIILGIIIAAVSSAFGSKFLIHSKAWYMYNPVRVVCLLVYALFIFMWELIKANVSMAGIVLSPNLKNCRPGVIRIPGSDKIRSNYGLAMVANSITLTPGTITMNVAEDESGKNYYYVQWIDVAQEDRTKAGEIIKGRMERAIARIWK